MRWHHILLLHCPFHFEVFTCFHFLTSVYSSNLIQKSLHILIHISLLFDHFLQFHSVICLLQFHKCNKQIFPFLFMLFHSLFKANSLSAQTHPFWNIPPPPTSISSPILIYNSSVILAINMFSYDFPDAFIKLIYL